MAVYTFLDIVRGCVTSAAFASFSAAWILYWHPLLRQVKDSCKAGNAHPKRGQLLWAVASGLVGWLLAVLIYVGNLYALRQLWTSFARDGCIQKLICTMLEVYFILMIVSGCLGITLTIGIACARIQELKDLLMIFKFSPGRSPRRPDYDAQSMVSQRSARSQSPDHTPPAPRSPSTLSATTVIEMSDLRMTRVSTDPSTTRVIHQSHHETDPPNTIPLHDVGESSRPQPGNRHPIGSQFRKNAYYMQVAKDEAYRRAARGSNSGFTANAPASSSSDTSEESSSHGVALERETSDPDHRATCRFPPPATHAPYPSLNLNGTTDSALSRCSTCSESHTSTIPHTRRASVREPLTPTSSSRGPGGIAKTWTEADTSCQHLNRRVSHASQLRSLLAGMEQRPAESDTLSAASTVSEFDNTFQDPPERHDPAIAGPVNSPAPVPSTFAVKLESETGAKSIDQSEQCSERLKAEDANPKNTIAEAGADYGKDAKGKGKAHEPTEELQAGREQPLHTNSRGQAITPALAAQRGIPTPPRLTPGSSSTSKSPSPSRGIHHPLSQTPSSTSASTSPGPHNPVPPRPTQVSSSASTSLSPGCGTPCPPLLTPASSSTLTSPGLNILEPLGPSPASSPTTNSPSHDLNVPNAPPPSPSTSQSERPTRADRVFADPKIVNLASNDRPNCRRILSPRLRTVVVRHEGGSSNSAESGISGPSTEEVDGKEIGEEVKDWLSKADHPSGNEYW